MINENFVFLAAILGTIGGINYLYDTLKGKVKPNKVTWFLWGLAPLIAFFAEIKQGVGIQALTTFSVGFMPILIFFASLVNKKSFWKITVFDLICGFFSLLGISLWYITKTGNIAILFSIVADGLASLPTLLKAFNNPETESYVVYFLYLIGAAITLLTVRIWILAEYAYPLYILILDLIFVLLIKFKFGKHLLSLKKLF